MRVYHQLGVVRVEIDSSEETERRDSEGHLLTDSAELLMLPQSTGAHHQNVTGVAAEGMYLCIRNLIRLVVSEK